MYMLYQLKDILEKQGFHILETGELNNPTGLHVWNPETHELKLSIEYSIHHLNLVLRTYAFDNLTENERINLNNPTYETLYKTIDRLLGNKENTTGSSTETVSE